jgi:hypothetical protein
MPEPYPEAEVGGDFLRSSALLVVFFFFFDGGWSEVRESQNVSGMGRYRLRHSWFDCASV